MTRLPVRELAGVRIFEARTLRSRLLGLAFLQELDAHDALLLPSCRGVHTFGMRFAIDVVFLDAAGRVIDVRHWVPPRRVVRCGKASAVLETRAGECHGFIRALVG